MQQNHAKHTPRHVANRVSFTPGFLPPNPQHKTATDQQRNRNAQLNRQMQGQVVGIVENLAKARTVVQVHVVRVIKFAPAPAQPRFLRDQLQHIAPQRQAAAAHRVPLPQTRKRAVPGRV